MMVLAVLVGGYFMYKKTKKEVIKIDTSMSLVTRENVSTEYYQELRDKCKEGKMDQLSCCLDSVKKMEVLRGTLFPKGNNNESGIYGCKEGLRRNVLKCVGSYEWCEIYDEVTDEGLIN